MAEPEKYILEKNIWTQEDFSQMGWHDASIYGFIIEKKDSWTGELLLDIDYIFKWIHPNEKEKSFSFYVAPCTLIFKHAFKLQVEIDTKDFSLEGLNIADIHLIEKIKHETGETTYHWDIELKEGNIRLESKGFEQIVRQKPIYLDEQSLDLERRGGINFGRNPYNL